MSVVDVHDLIQTTLLGEAAEHAPIAIVVADEEMCCVAANRAACDLLGYEREELLALRITDVSADLAPADRFRELVAAGGLSGHASVARKDGTTIEVDYDAFTTKVAQMLVYVTFVKPVSG